VKNFLTVTLLSLGMPMIAMGDEVRRTQAGNNNAYCQDNEVSWFDWSLVEKHADLYRFVRVLNEQRVHRELEHDHERLTLTDLIKRADLAWHGVKLLQPDWGDDSHSVAFGAKLLVEGLSFHLILNAFYEPLDFELPPLEGKHVWRRWIDTFLPSPQDIVPWQEAPPVTGGTYRAQPRSVVMLFTLANQL
jgi:glycogen operon protein